MQVVHMQLIQEQKSRINACDREGWQRNFGRCVLSKSAGREILMYPRSICTNSRVTGQSL